MLRELSRRVHAGVISSTELIYESIRRIEASNGAINAVVATDFTRALEAARKVDDAVARNEDLGVLAGIPILVKDVEDVAGLPTTHGSLTRAGAKPAESSGLVPGRLMDAGAIVIGKTNAPEYSFEVYTSNRLFGSTVNPWAPDWSPGGSSGGSAAAIAAGFAPIATATDGGGSIRIPGAFCGLAGLKPTSGIVPRSPIPAWIDLSTDGPMATSIDDLELLFNLISGVADGDPNAVPRNSLRRAAFSRPIQVLAAPRTYDWGPLPTEIQQFFDRALLSLHHDLALEITPISAGEIFRSGNPDLDWFVLCCTEQAHLLGHQFIEDNAERFDEIFLGHMRFGMSRTLENYLDARRLRFAYTAEFDALLGSEKILATPTMAVQGFLPDGRPDAQSAPGIGPEALNTVIQNITGNPAITLPAGVLSNGVPFGLQLTGPRYSELLLLELGRLWEASNPWPLTAPNYRSFTTEGLNL